MAAVRLRSPKLLRMVLDEPRRDEVDRPAQSHRDGRCTVGEFHGIP